MYFESVIPSFPCLSTDQVAALIALGREGSLRRAAETLSISEQGLRNRLLILEERLGVELYIKSRGPRTRSPLTSNGRRLLSHATRFMEQAQHLSALFRAEEEPKVIHVAATQYLILYLLIDAVREFHRRFPQIRVRLSSRIEEEIEEELLSESDIEMGVAAPYDPSSLLEYRHVFTMHWSLITPRGHPLLQRQRIRLRDLKDQPLILFERGSTGRQHVMEAFREQGLSPRVEMETTNTEIIVRMVEAGLGVSLVPLPSNGSVTKGRKVGIRTLGETIRPIQSGILMRTDETLSQSAKQFADFICAHKL